MIGNLNWNNVFLKKNPFDLTPPTDPEQIIWAGMKGVKQQFEQVFEEAIDDSVSQVVLNQGPWGSGKTHASHYFGNEKNLLLKQGDKSKVYQIRVCVPKEPGKPAEDFYIDVLDTVGMENIRNIIRDAIENFSEDEALDLLKKVLGSEEFARAFWLFGTEKVNERLALLRAYFFGEVTRTELRKLGIARNISKSQDRFRVLVGVLQCIIGLDLNSSSSRPLRVCLWIDEMEDLLYLTSAQFRIVSQGLRDMIDRLPNHFTLFLNMTLSAPEEHEEFEVILGNALINRITDVIYFRELSIDESQQYVIELINNPQNRIESDHLNGLPRTYPFEETALKMLLEDMEQKTPREINKRCRNAINFAFRENKFTDHGNGIIDTTFVRTLEESELDREIV